MDQNTNMEAMDVEVKEVAVVEEQTEEVKGFIPKVKAWFKENGKVIAKVALFGSAVLGAGYALGKRSNGQSDAIDISDEDIVECNDNDDVEVTEF